jgi:hypothetical protein
MKKSKNEELVLDFARFCYLNPDLRFWQALRTWANVNFILFSKKNPNEATVNDLTDTFYLEGKNK